MKQQTRHNLLQFFLYMCTCSLGGFTAVFLQYKGMSNTWIGIITGLGSCGILFGSPLINYLMQRFSWLSVKKTLYLSFSAMIFSYVLMTWPHMPRLIIGILYVSTTILIFCMLPLITLLSTERIWGLARRNFWPAWHQIQQDHKR